MIYFSMKYTAEKSGRIIRHVTCEKCGSEYVYPHDVKITTSTESPFFLNNTEARDKAERSARKQFEREINKGVRIVPCPSCGQIQPEMVEKLRVELRERYRNAIVMLGFVLFIMVIVIICSISFEYYIRLAISSTISAIIGITMVILLYREKSHPKRYDPNVKLDQIVRKHEGKQLAMLKADYEQKLKDEAEADEQRLKARAEANELRKKYENPFEDEA